MRLKANDEVRLFNGRDGEWHGKIEGSKTGKGKRGVTVMVCDSLRPQSGEPDLWLCAAPIKKAHFDYMVEKATELGTTVIQPVLTARTQIRDVNAERLKMIAIEAAEQSERLSVPAIHSPLPLSDIAASWPKERTLIVCAEWGDALPAETAFARMNKITKAAILTGPEGGFAEDELALLKKVPGSVFIRLGPRILRADTAAIAALSLWQALCGDWKAKG
jgi:16S rRNA (uracil1498-N3)-methyltransferase